MRIAGTIPCSLVNGPGIRYVIFTQGCPHKCFGCQNPETWDAEGGVLVQPSTIWESIIDHVRTLDGITISGGEPYLQGQELLYLMNWVRSTDLTKNLDIWLYTGYEWEDIKDHPLTKLVDVVVTGRFHMSEKVTGKLYGSSNQRVIDTKTGKVLEGY